MKLKKWLKTTRFTVRSFAILMKVSRNTVYRWFNGDSIPNPKKMDKICMITMKQVNSVQDVRGKK